MELYISIYRQAVKSILSKANSKKVCQIDVTTGEIIKIHKSATKAAIELGFPKSNSDIGKMCNGRIVRNHVIGYKWKWFSEE